jgi:LysR family hydrogen peroxide-inducible transcriptional activator
LLPALSVLPPIVQSDGIRLLRFSDPVPRRDIALVWRRSSTLGDLLGAVAEVARTAPGVPTTG